MQLAPTSGLHARFAEDIYWGQRSTEWQQGVWPKVACQMWQLNTEMQMCCVLGLFEHT